MDGEDAVRRPRFLIPPSGRAVTTPDADVKAAVDYMVSAAK